MPSITNTILAADLDYAIADNGVTLTIETPVEHVGETIAASRSRLQMSYSVQIAGRLMEVTTRFTIKLTGLFAEPEKGWLFQTSEGNDHFKIASVSKDPSGVGMMIDAVNMSES